MDAEGRIVLPQELRDRLGLTPGTEVAVREKDGKAVVEPEDDPERIIDRMERLIEETSSGRAETSSLADGIDPIARKHRDRIRRRAAESDDE